MAYSAKKYHSRKRHSAKRHSAKKHSVKRHSAKKHSVKRHSSKKHRSPKKHTRRSRVNSHYRMRGMGVLLNMYGGASEALEQEVAAKRRNSKILKHN